ncbi:MAG: hypothetical protein SGILL_010043 [Bacillariaceae sp.]
MSNSAEQSVVEYLDDACRKLFDLDRMDTLRLRHADLESEHIPLLTRTLRQATWLKQLEIYNCAKLGPDDIVQLCDTLKSNTQLWYISFAGLDFGNRGLAALTQLLTARATAGNNIDFLRLENCLNSMRGASSETDEQDTGYETIDTHVWEEFAAVACRTLRSLDLTRNRLFSDRHIPALVKGIGNKSEPCRLLSLIITDNPIGDDGMQGLCGAIQNNRTLTMLSCAECGLTDASNEYLLEALRHNSSLRRVYIYGNKNSTTNSTSEPWRFWLRLNANGRGLLEKDDGPSSLTPTILARVSSNDPTILHGLLKESARYFRS